MTEILSTEWVIQINRSGTWEYWGVSSWPTKPEAESFRERLYDGEFPTRLVRVTHVVETEQDAVDLPAVQIAPMTQQVVDAYLAARDAFLVLDMPDDDAVRTVEHARYQHAGVLVAEMLVCEMDRAS